MKHLILTMLTISLALGCEKSQSNSSISGAQSPSDTPKESSQQYTPFEKYIHSLEKVQLPFRYSSREELNPDEQLPYDPTEFERYKQTWAERPLGLLKTTHDFIVTVDLVVGDHGYVPYLMCYNRSGTKVDSINAFAHAGVDMGYVGHEHITIDEDLTITVLDSVWQMALKADRSDVIAGSETLTTGTTIYQWNREGKFELVEGKMIPMDCKLGVSITTITES